MPKLVEDGWITVPRAAELLGVRAHTLYSLIDRGVLAAEVVMPVGVGRRRKIRIRRVAVDEYLERARVKPGELRHLYL